MSLLHFYPPLFAVLLKWQASWKASEQILLPRSELKLKETDEEISVTTTKESQHLFYHKSPANKTMYKIHAKNTITHKTHLKPDQNTISTIAGMKPVRPSIFSEKHNHVCILDAAWIQFSPQQWGTGSPTLVTPQAAARLQHTWAPRLGTRGLSPPHQIPLKQCLQEVGGVSEERTQFSS